MRLLLHLPILFIVFMTVTSSAQTANYIWAQRFGGINNDNCKSKCDPAGNVYRMQGGIAKHNSAGVQQWTITTLYNTQAIVFDAAGDLYVLGIFTGTIDLDHGAGTNTVASAGGVDLAVLKLSASTGNFIWGGVIGGTGNDYETAINSDAAGNLYFGGTFTGDYDVDPGPAVHNFTATSTDFFVTKLNTSGNLQWAKQFTGTSGGYIAALKVNPANEIYFCGSFSGTRDFDPGISIYNLSASSATINDIYISKLDAGGNFLWAQQIGSTGTDNAYDLDLGANGNIYCTGLFTGNVDFDGGTGTLTINSGTASNAFVGEFNSSGTPVWVRNYADISIAAIAVDKNNAVCMVGSFVKADFDPGAGTYTMVAIGQYSWVDTYITLLSSAGHFLWAKQIGGLNDDGVNTLSIDNGNNIHISGRFKTTCDFDPNGGYEPLTAAGGNFNYDGYLLKLCQTPGAFVVQGKQNVCSGDSLIYSISPLPDAQSYFWKLPTGWAGKSSTISIGAMAGTTSGSISLTAYNSCGATLKTVQVSSDLCTGFTEQDMASTVIYPNPSEGTLYILTDEFVNAYVINALGEVVMQRSLSAGKNSLEFEGYKAGVYLVQLSKGEERRTMKLVLR